MLRLTKSCVVCGRDYTTRSRSPEREKYCSQTCRAAYANKTGWQRNRHKYIKWQPIERTCEVCAKTFMAKSSRHMTDSLLCNQRRQDQRKKARVLEHWDQTPRACAICGTDFVPGRYAWHRQKYCSRACVQTARSREQPPRKSRKLPDRLRRTLDERCGGACERCGEKPRRLERHHRDWNWRHNTPENLIVLCHPCHVAMEVKSRVEDGVLVLTSAQWEWFTPDKVRFALPA